MPIANREPLSSRYSCLDLNEATSAKRLDHGGGNVYGYCRQSLKALLPLGA